jgi:SAM-dependent methyltransferase
MTRVATDQKYVEDRYPPSAAALAVFPQDSWAVETGCIVPSPKQSGAGFLGRAGWYPYYAGYSAAFVRSVLDRCKLGREAVVLDPWNGAGTTTQVANDLGYDAVGFDLNPAMVLVAKARLLDQRQIPELRQALEAVTRAARSYRTRIYIQDDPLGLWLSPDTVREVRHTERAIRQVLEGNGITGCSKINNMTIHGSFAYLALFRTLRHSLSGFKASNPVWLKTAKSENELVSLSREELAATFGHYFISMLDSYDYDQFQPSDESRSTVRIEVANSVQVPHASHVADIVISSPPYCTRIDYAVATSVELAVLGLDPRGSLKELRDRMIGTSTIRAVPPEMDARWGQTCNALLDKISEHNSKASKSYYFKNHIQYFDGMYHSLMEIGRCLRPGGHCVLVLQDSYYKDIHNDLPQIIAEMADSLGWKLRCRSDFRVSRTMAGRNGHSRRYRHSNVATESVLWFRPPERRD